MSTQYTFFRYIGTYGLWQLRYGYTSFLCDLYINNMAENCEILYVPQLILKECPNV